MTAEDTWEFERGEIGIEDADIVYANFPRGDISNTVVEGMAREMDEEAIAVIPDGGYEARNQYFEEAGITDFDFVYELDSRP